MCELLALSFNYPVTPSFSLKGFRKRGKNNPHGWGLAFYPDKSCQVIKEPVHALNSILSDFVENYPKITSNILIAHVRYNSVGAANYQNTHPFQRELNGKAYVFAHNGTLKDYQGDFDTYNYKPVGETDSEALFCHLLNRIKEEEIDFNNKNNLNWLLSELRVLNDYGPLNCLFSDGEYLFAYHDESGYKGLNYLRRKTPYGPVNLLDEDYSIDLSEEKTPYQRGFIIATNPLTDEKWESFQPGELLVMKNGEIIFKKS